jgi:hypothetical protein
LEIKNNHPVQPTDIQSVVAGLDACKNQGEYDIGDKGEH